MSRLKTLLAILYRFIVGDDATVALAVVAALALTAALAALGLSAWWLLPGTVIGTLAMSLNGPPAPRRSRIHESRTPTRDEANNAPVQRPDAD